MYRRLALCRRGFSSAPGGQPRSEGLRRASELSLPVAAALPPSTKVVVCGGGAQGAAIAYKLAQRGLGPNTVLIDKAKFAQEGSTHHCSGLIPLLKMSPIETRLSKMSKDLYEELEDKGWYTGWSGKGSLHVAQTLERMHHYRRMKSTAVGRRVDCEIITNPDEILNRCDILNVKDLKGALYVPGDGVANPTEICLALAQLAAEMGVTLIEDCEVKQVVNYRGAVKGVETNLGYVECEHFVNTAGLWARYVGTLSYPRVQIPIHAAEHYIIHTVPNEQSKAATYPVIRDPDSNLYLRENEGRFMIGGWEKVSKAAYEDGILPGQPGASELPLDWDHIYATMESVIKRFPSLMNAKLGYLTNDPEPYSPDAEWILGHAPEIKNYWVAAGMRSSGVGAAGGVGELIADCITTGRTKFDMYNLDILRFLPIHNNRKFLRDRVTEVPSRLSSIPYPFLEYKTGRSLRTSPIFTKLKHAGAKFDQVMGYERPMYFTDPSEISLEGGLMGLMGGDGGGIGSSSSLSMSRAKLNTFYQPPWFDAVEREFIASREACSLSDFSSFAKMDVWSSHGEAAEFLQRMCSGNVDVKIGSVVYTGMQNPDGGYENDCTVARLAHNRYMLMSPSIQQMRSFFWLKSHLPADRSVHLQDCTSLYTTLCLMGPKSHELLSRLTPPEEDLNFRPFSAFYLDIGCAPGVLTINATPTGEQGYVFYIPNEFAVHIYDEILAAGKDLGIEQCGYYAMRALRIEKFYAFWGQDLDSQSTPLECGRMFRCKMGENDADFIGKDALKKQLETGIHKMLVMMLFDPLEHDLHNDPWPWGGEPIYRDNKFVGNVTTASYGFSLKRMIGIGFVRKFAEDGVTEEILDKDYVKNGKYEVEIAGTRYPVEVKLNSAAIPKSVVRKTTVSSSYQATRHD